MADKAGFNQPRDRYQSRHSTFGVDSPPIYTPQIPPPQEGDDRQPCLIQPANPPDTNATEPVDQPQSSNVISNERPPDYMLASTLACFCCFWPLGLIALYYANEANNCAYTGDYSKARMNADYARGLIIGSAIVASALWIYVTLLSIGIEAFIFDTFVRETRNYSFVQ